MREPAASPFPADALPTNRSGLLTDRQRANLGTLSSYRRRNALTIAAFLTGGAMIVIFLARPDAPVRLRWGTAGGALAIAAFLVLRSISGADALTEDLEEARVQSTEGAIGKRRISGGGRTPAAHVLEVGDDTFKIGPATYDWLPQAGRARVYFLPRSRSVVNIELLPNPGIPGDLTAGNLMERLGGPLLSRGRGGNEARADLAGIADALKATFDQPAQPPPATARGARPLAEAIVGSWANEIVRATFDADGTLAIRMFSGERKGRWSVDAAGRLRADITGGEQTIDAWIDGDRLTIDMDGRGVTLTRQRV